MNTETELNYYKETIKRFDDILKIDENNSNALCWKGYTIFKEYQQLKDDNLLKEAYQCVVKSLKIDLYNFNSWEILGEIYETAGKPELSQKCMVCYKTITRENKGQKKRLVEILKKDTNSVLWENKGNQKSLPEGKLLEV